EGRSWRAASRVCGVEGGTARAGGAADQVGCRAGGGRGGGGGGGGDWGEPGSCGWRGGLIGAYEGRDMGARATVRGGGWRVLGVDLGCLRVDTRGNTPRRPSPPGGELAGFC
ncbi:MAG: hypothetical protein OXG25_00045, partial [Gammaproteobacteria bacterium]|nr:hypothetical protein [Gammaproteobacteria bacterium]